MAGTYIALGFGEGGGSSTAIANAVPTAAALPAAGDSNGQLIYVIDTESIYAWDSGGSSWGQILNGLADVSGPSGATDNRLCLFSGATGKLIKEASAITASKALVSDASGVPTASGVSSTTLAFLDATSSVQTQIDSKVTGPGSATDTAIAVYDGTTGKLVKNSLATIDGAGAISAPKMAPASYMLMPNLTTAQRDALTGAKGLVIYNTDTDRFQGYVNAAWVDLHGWGA